MRARRGVGLGEIAFRLLFVGGGAVVVVLLAVGYLLGRWL